MGEYTSYYLYQRYEQREGQDTIPCTPNVYSIDGYGTMQKVIKLDNDPNCGYNPQEPIYRWYQIPITEDYMCANCDEGTIYQWNLVNGYICDDCGSNKLSVGVSANTYSLDCSTASTITSGDVVSLTSKASIQWAVIGNCVDSIGNNAFSGCTAMEFCRIPNSVKSIGDSAFASCSVMMECSLPSGIETIGNSAFTNSISLAYINLPDGITSLGRAAFRGCLNFRYINIPNSLTTIPSYCFYNCDGMTDIELHSGVTSIGDYAFYGCDGIYSMTLHSTIPPTIGSNTLSYTSSSLKIYVPSGSVEVYKTTDIWRNYANKIYPIE